MNDVLCEFTAVLIHKKVKVLARAIESNNTKAQFPLPELTARVDG